MSRSRSHRFSLPIIPRSGVAEAEDTRVDEQGKAGEAQVRHHEVPYRRELAGEGPSRHFGPAAAIGADVELTFEVRARVDDGIPPETVRAVSENCSTLGVGDFGFGE